MNVSILTGLITYFVTRYHWQKERDLLKEQHNDNRLQAHRMYKLEINKLKLEKEKWEAEKNSKQHQ